MCWPVADLSLFTCKCGEMQGEREGATEAEEGAECSEDEEPEQDEQVDPEIDVDEASE